MLSSKFCSLFFTSYYSIDCKSWKNWKSLKIPNLDWFCLYFARYWKRAPCSAADTPWASMRLRHIYQDDLILSQILRTRILSWKVDLNLAANSDRTSCYLQSFCLTFSDSDWIYKKNRLASRSRSFSRTPLCSKSWLVSGWRLDFELWAALNWKYWNMLADCFSQFEYLHLWEEGQV